MDMDKSKETTTKIKIVKNHSEEMLRLKEEMEQSEIFSFKSSLIPSLHSSGHFLNLRKKTLPDA